MTHKEAPPITPEQERFEKFWTGLKGPGYTGFGRGKDGGYLCEFSRDAFRAWEAAQECSLVESDMIFGAMSPECVYDTQQSTQRAREFWATYGGYVSRGPMVRVDRSYEGTFSPCEASEGDK